MAKWCIDAGHGGKDPGATNSVATEKSINLIVALEVGRILTEHEEQVIYTRTGDQYVSIEDRAKKANAAKADYFVSIHHNGGGGDGGEIIHSVSNGQGKILAERIGKTFEGVDQNMRKIFSKPMPHAPGTDYFGVIRLTKMPAVITEFGFMDNVKDFAQFDERAEQLLEARAVAQACLEHVGKPMHEGIEWIVSMLVKKGYATNSNHWLGVLRGTQPVNLDYLKILLERVARD